MTGEIAVGRDFLAQAAVAQRAAGLVLPESARDFTDPDSTCEPIRGQRQVENLQRVLRLPVALRAIVLGADPEAEFESDEATRALEVLSAIASASVPFVGPYQSFFGVPGRPPVTHDIVERAIADAQDEQRLSAEENGRARFVKAVNRLSDTAHTGIHIVSSSLTVYIGSSQPESDATQRIAAAVAATGFECVIGDTSVDHRARHIRRSLGGIIDSRPPNLATINDRALLKFLRLPVRQLDFEDDASVAAIAELRVPAAR